MTSNLTTAGENVTFARGRRSGAVGMVAFLFGTVDTEELPGLALVHLLGDLGIGETAARGLLARMRRDGQLRAVRHGREVGYRLTGPFALTFRRLRRPVPPPMRWEGRFHALLHQVPEEHRAYRDRLRRTANFAGYGVMQPGVLVAVRDAYPGVAAVLAEAPAGCRLHRATIALERGDAAAVAGTAWDLNALAARFRGHVAALAEAMRRPEELTASAASLRRFVELRNAPLVDLIADPGLPAELLPAGWPGARLVELTDAVFRRYGPPAIAYVHAVLAELPGAPPRGSRPVPHRLRAEHPGGP